MPSDAASGPAFAPDFQQALDALPQPLPGTGARQAFAPLRVLSLTGGGYRGLFTAQALVTLCRKAGHEGALDGAFDVFAGTSIGGLMACALAVGIAPRQVLEAIDAHGPRVFAPRKAGTLRRLLFGTLYDSGHLSEAIDACLGPHAATPMSAIAKGLVVPAVDWVHGRVQVFRSGFFGRAHASDATLKQACLATSAAPTYFEPGQIDGLPMLDGGLAVNNPDMLALMEIMRRSPASLERVEMLSLGTAGHQPLRPAEAASRAGLQWAADLPGFIMDVQERTASAQAGELLQQRYLRVNHEGEPLPAFMRLDLASGEARDRLLAAARQAATAAYAAHGQQIDRLFSPLRL
ncbi:MAG: patatin-like phospholipase family protein [Burkholderiaceae bacterium]|jgi:patatin-like phospholipase/acyl hydrolase|nr:patatin-like phospholipase family protein [Burkholderiaceae bacterium]